MRDGESGGGSKNRVSERGSGNGDRRRRVTSCLSCLGEKIRFPIFARSGRNFDPLSSQKDLLVDRVQNLGIPFFVITV